MEVDADEARAALAKVLASQTFQCSQQLREFLASDRRRLAIEKDNAELHRDQGRAQRTDRILDLPAQMLAECKPVKESG